MLCQGSCLLRDCAHISYNAHNLVPSCTSLRQMSHQCFTPFDPAQSEVYNFARRIRADIPRPNKQRLMLERNEPTKKQIGKINWSDVLDILFRSMSKASMPETVLADGLAGGPELESHNSRLGHFIIHSIYALCTHNPRWDTHKLLLLLLLVWIGLDNKVWLGLLVWI